MMNATNSEDDYDPAQEELAFARPPMSRGAWVLTALGLGVLLAIASWVGWGQASQPVRWQDVGYQVVSPTEATVTFDVFLYADEPALCYLRALNERFAEVGVSEVHIDPADGREQRFTTTIATVEPATTAVVRHCGPA